MYDNPNVTVHFNTETVDIVSNTKGQMSGILVRKLDSGEESVLEAKGLFYGIGHSPNTQLLKGQVELDQSGYLLVKEGTAKTSVEGVFAAGDVQVTYWMLCVDILDRYEESMFERIGENRNNNSCCCYYYYYRTESL